jgi:hypothetical protein
MRFIALAVISVLGLSSITSADNPSAICVSKVDPEKFGVYAACPAQESRPTPAQMTALCTSKACRDAENKMNVEYRKCGAYGILTAEMNEFGCLKDNKNGNLCYAYGGEYNPMNALDVCDTKSCCLIELYARGNFRDSDAVKAKNIADFEAKCGVKRSDCSDIAGASILL